MKWWIITEFVFLASFGGSEVDIALCTELCSKETTSLQKDPQKQSLSLVLIFFYPLFSTPWCFLLCSKPLTPEIPLLKASQRAGTPLLQNKPQNRRGHLSFESQRHSASYLRGRSAVRRDQELCKPPGFVGIPLQSCNSKNKPHKFFKPYCISIPLPFFTRTEQKKPMLPLTKGLNFWKFNGYIHLGYTNLLCVSLVSLSFTWPYWVREWLPSSFSFTAPGRDYFVPCSLNFPLLL